jgi:RNA polymerase sigma-70 factor, ECF subfamily
LRAREPACLPRCHHCDNRTAVRREARLDDMALIDRARSGDLASYGELIRRYQEHAYRAAYLVTGSESDARDAAQEGFVKAYARLGQLRSPKAFRGWLLSIVCNEARNRRRADGRWRALAIRVEETPPPTPEALVLQAEDQRELLRAVEGLREGDRMVIACRYFLELSEEETAEMLGWPRGTVKSRLSRAIAKLREVIQQRGGLLDLESSGAADV